MKNFRPLGALALTLIAAPWTGSVYAFTYADGDLLLAFRKPGRNDVTHNLGSVTNLLNVPNGQTVVVTNWNKTLTLNAYDNTLDDGVEVALMAATGLSATPRTAWVSTGDPTSEPLLPTSSNWQVYWSQISSVGIKLQQLTSESADESISIGSTELQSYSYIMSGAGTQPTQIPYLGGAAKFVVEAAPPATLRLIELNPSTAIPKPGAKVLGSFAIDADGNLTYTAGTGSTPIEPSLITGAQIADGVITLTFTTQSDAKYRLLGSSDTGLSPVNQWSVVAGPVDGTGAPMALSDPTSAALRVYAVESFR